MIFISKCLKCKRWHKNKKMFIWDYSDYVIASYQKFCRRHPYIEGPLCFSCVPRNASFKVESLDEFKQKYPDAISKDAVLIYDGHRIKVYQETIKVNNDG